jgi:hypothetical protein
MAKVEEDQENSCQAEEVMKQVTPPMEDSLTHSSMNVGKWPMSLEFLAKVCHICLGTDF